MPLPNYDIVIIGGGIVGLATAYRLMQDTRASIAVIEAENRLAAHQTGNNSGVIHSGLYYKPGSLKAKNCVQGREAMYQFCAGHNIPHERCGKLVVATDEEEIPRLKELHQRGKANGLTSLEWLENGELRKHEPHVQGVAGILVTETGIVDYRQVTQKLADLLRNAGHAILLNHRFIGLKRKGHTLCIETNQQNLESGFLINCGGLYSDRIARRCGIKSDVKIVPFRGEYYKIKPHKRYLVRNLIYPVPDPAFPFLGVHFTRMIDGRVEAGPNAVLALKREGYNKFSFSLRDTLETFTYPGFLKLAKNYYKMGFIEYYRSVNKKAFVRALKRLIPSIDETDLEPGGAGIRAQALEKSGLLVDDFRIIEGPQMIHVLNAPSPAATASLSIGQTISQMASRNFDL